MSESAARLMTVEEYLPWAAQQAARYELLDGTPVAMAPERVEHADVKLAVAVALRDAIQKAGVECRAYPDGMTVRINAQTAFEPDASVNCGPRPPADALELNAPIVVVEVMSPSSKSIDLVAKLEGYAQVNSIAHYLVFDTERRKVIHHRRAGPDRFDTHIVSTGEIVLDPPGIAIGVDAIFIEALDDPGR